jgi:hypothetical protein
VLGAALACVAGCGSPPGVDEELATVRSWTATTDLATSEFRTGALSRRYVIQLAERAREARREATTALAAAAKAPHDGARAGAALDSLDEAIRHLVPADAR